MIPVAGRQRDGGSSWSSSSWHGGSVTAIVYPEGRPSASARETPFGAWGGSFVIGCSRPIGQEPLWGRRGTMEQGMALFAGVAPDIIRAAARETEATGYSSF